MDKVTDKKNKQIIKILQKNNFDENLIAQIILKQDRAIISIQVDKEKSDQEKITKNAKKAEEKIAKKLKLDKVTIVLTLDNEVKNTQEKSQEKPQEVPTSTPSKKPKGVKRIIAVASAKGGVGKSTLAANIAITLSRIGHKVALVDADIYGPSIASIMNLDEKPHNENNLIIPHQKYGVKFISVANLIDKNAAGIWRAAMINKILHQLIAQTNWTYDDKEVDIMIVDMPPGTGDIYLSLAQNFDLDAAILVSTPQNLSQIDLVRSIDCFEKLNVKILGLIENMAYFIEKDGEKNYIFGKSNLSELAKQRNIKLIDSIAILKDLGNNEDKAPLCYEKPNHPFSHQIGMICEEIII